MLDWTEHELKTSVIVHRVNMINQPKQLPKVKRVRRLALRITPIELTFLRPHQQLLFIRLQRPKSQLTERKMIVINNITCSIQVLCVCFKHVHREKDRRIKR